MNMGEVWAALRIGTEMAGGDGRRALFAEARNLRLPAARYAEFRALGDRLSEQEIPDLPFRLYRLYDTTGDREAYQAAYFERRKRMGVFAVLALAGDGRGASGALAEDGRASAAFEASSGTGREASGALAALEDVLWAICGEYTWCLPAHLGGRSLDPAAEHRTVIDLFAAETAFYLAEIVCLMEERLSPLVAERVRREIRSRVLGPYASLSPAAWWETTDMNWAAVCAGSVGAAAMYLIREDDILAPLLHRAVSTMEGFIAGFPEDGACLEGLKYWTYGFGFYVAFASLLSQRTGGIVDLLQGEKIRRIARFQQKCYLDGHTVISYSDSSDAGEFQPGLTHYLRRRFADVEVPSRACEAGVLGDDCFRWMHAIRNLAWYEEAFADGELGEAVEYMPDAQIVVCRGRMGNRSVGFSAKGGHNGEPHNHNDAGSFILLADGEQLLADPGSGVYTREYFGEGRYELIYNGSHGHSVPVVDGDFQRAGSERRAVVRHADFADSRTVFELELAAAYGNENLRSLVRRFYFDKQQGLLRLRDDYAYVGGYAGAFRERFVSFRKPETAGEGLIRITGREGAVLNIRFDPKQLAPELGQERFLENRLGKEILYLVDLSAVERKNRDSVAVEIRLEWKEKSLPT
ncbi:heparinase II/III domain-containing protein [Cohnella caldifontis]|uniref:heparinase II/III domain-containing protein n=1 Tax=Cohnella caldifontis TaxID=3027471 RepID=UPI0023ED0350|nr:heparinase II/III family protein [Cohnella sp. YIM B05605]